MQFARESHHWETNFEHLITNVIGRQQKQEAHSPFCMMPNSFGSCSPSDSVSCCHPTSHPRPPLFRSHMHTNKPTHSYIYDEFMASGWVSECVCEKERFDPIRRTKVNSGKGSFLFDLNNKNCPAVNKVTAVQFYAPVFPSSLSHSELIFQPLSAATNWQGKGAFFPSRICFILRVRIPITHIKEAQSDNW